MVALRLALVFNWVIRLNAHADLRAHALAAKQEETRWRVCTPVSQDF